MFHYPLVNKKKGQGLDVYSLWVIVSPGGSLAQESICLLFRHKIIETPRRCTSRRPIQNQQLQLNTILILTTITVKHGWKMSIV